MAQRQGAEGRAGVGDERLSRLVITETHRSAIGAALERLQVASEARCVMLLDISGMLLGWRGDVAANKAEMLGVLLANGFVAAKQVAAILGQPKFEAMLQQGRTQHILSEAVGDHWVLITIFEDRTAEGIIRLLSGRTVRELVPTLDRVRAESAELERQRAAGIPVAARADEPGAPRPRRGALAAGNPIDELFRDGP